MIIANQLIQDSMNNCCRQTTHLFLTHLWHREPPYVRDTVFNRRVIDISSLGLAGWTWSTQQVTKVIYWFIDLYNIHVYSLSPSVHDSHRTFIQLHNWQNHCIVKIIALKVSLRLISLVLSTMKSLTQNYAATCGSESY